METMLDGGTANHTQQAGERSDASVPPTFLRLDRPELIGNNLVVKAVSRDTRERRRVAGTAPLAYLYQHTQGDELESDLKMSAGHYDQANLVWSFSGEVSGIIGLTEPFSPAEETPGHVEREGL
jgi:hypothetical protein